MKRLIDAVAFLGLIAAGTVLVLVGEMGDQIQYKETVRFLCYVVLAASVFRVFK